MLIDLFQFLPQLRLFVDLFQCRQPQAKLLQSFNHEIFQAGPQRLWLWDLRHESGPIVREQSCSKHDRHGPATQAGYVNVVVISATLMNRLVARPNEVTQIKRAKRVLDTHPAEALDVKEQVAMTGECEASME